MKKSIKSIFPLILCLVILIITIIIVRNNNSTSSKSQGTPNIFSSQKKFKNKQKDTLPDGEMKAVWVPFMELN